MFFQTMYNVVDTFCAGWLGTEALAALSISFPIFFLAVAVGSGVSQGTTALLANALGRGDEGEARRAFAQAITFILMVSVVLTVLGLLFAPSLFRILGAEGRYLKTSLGYMNVIIVGTVFLLLPMVLNSALNSAGEARPFRNFLICGCFANLLLNPLFILGWFGLPKLGTAVIGLATVLVQIGGCIYLGMRVASRDVYSKLHPAGFRPDIGTLRQIAGQAVPAALNMLTIAVGIFIVTWFVKSFGQDVVAAIGIATRLEQIALMPVIGLNFAVLSIVGQNHGAGKHDRVREAWFTNLRFGVAIMVLGGLFVWLLRKPAMLLFTDDPAVVDHGTNYLLCAALTLAAYPILFVTTFAMQGIKRPGFGVWMGLYRQLCAPFVVFHLLAVTLGWGAWGVWWCICLISWSAAAFCIAYGWRKLGR